MASLQDVKQSITDLISVQLFGEKYVEGILAPSTIAGCTVMLHIGWPTDAILDSALGNAENTFSATNTLSPYDYQAIVSINPDKNMSDYATKSIPHEYQYWTNIPSLTLALSSGSASFSGTISSSDLVGMTCVSGGIQYSNNYRVQANDTLDSITSYYATAIPSASIVAGAISWPDTVQASLAIFTDQQLLRVVRRENQQMRISVWTPNAGIRSSLGDIVDGALNNHPYGLTFEDGTGSGPLLFKGIHEDDMPISTHLWRRDYIYTIDYPVTQTITYTPIAVVNLTTTLNNGTATRRFFGPTTQ